MTNAGNFFDTQLTEKFDVRRKVAAAKHAIKVLSEDGRDDLEDGLYALYYTQRSISDLSGKAVTLGEPPSKDQIRTVFVALFVELGELVQELDWKPWKEPKQVDNAKIAGEFADILAFIGLLLVYFEGLGVDANKLAEAYLEKSKTNYARFTGQVDGYRAEANTLLTTPE